MLTGRVFRHDIHGSGLATYSLASTVDPDVLRLDRIFRLGQIEVFLQQTLVQRRIRRILQHTARHSGTVIKKIYILEDK